MTKCDASAAPNTLCVMLTAVLALTSASGVAVGKDLLAFTTPDKDTRNYALDINWCARLADHLAGQTGFVIPTRGEALVHGLETDRFFDQGKPVVDAEGRPVPNSTSVKAGASRSTRIYAICLRERGYEWLSAEEIDAALAKWMPLAEQGDPRAQFIIGSHYEDGKGVERDPGLALEWYTRSAEQGYVSAQVYLAALYDQGLGVPEDDARAAYWYRKAAEQDDARAQTNLGIMYHHGYGVEQDDYEARKWLEKAAGQKFPPAQNAYEDLPEDQGD